MNFKKISRRDFLKAAGLSAAALGLAAGGGSASSSTAAASAAAAGEDAKTIYVIVKVLGNQYWSVLQAGAEQAGRDLGCNVVVVGTALESDIEGSSPCSRTPFRRRRGAPSAASASSPNWRKRSWRASARRCSRSMKNTARAIRT